VDAVTAPALESLYDEPDARPASIAPMLEAVDVFRIFGAGAVETVALRGLSLAVAAGEVVALLGPSGCGKSTFLHLAAGLDPPSAGEVRVGGIPLGRLDEAALAGYRARGVSVVFQGQNLWPELTAHENVVLALRLAGLTSAGVRAARALERFDLATRAHVRAAVLSGGEQQRVAIAACAARETPLVLCDEPTGELDTRNEVVVIEALLRLRADDGATVVVTTHSERVAESCDRVIELRDGRIA